MSILSQRARLLRGTLAIFASIVTVTFLVQCSKDDPDKKDPKKLGEELALAGRRAIRPHALVPDQILVVDENEKVVPSVSLQFGDKADPANIFATNADGLLPIPQLWTNEMSITLMATGYTRATYFAQSPGGKIFHLHHAESTKIFQSTGQTNGIDPQRDGKLDFALVLPILNKHNFVQLDFNQIISPLQDQMSIAGQQLTLPSNVVLPYQKETYLLFPVEINKPNFRVFSQKEGSIELSGLRGQLSFSQTIDAAKSGFDVIKILNLADFQADGLTTIASGGANLSIPTNQTTLSKKLSITTPAVTQGLTLLVLSMHPDSKSNGYIIEDMKGVSNTRGSVTLSTSNSETALIAFILLRTTEFQGQSYIHALSAAVYPLKNASNVQMINLTSAMQVVDSKHVTVKPPATVPTSEQKIFGSLSQVISGKFGGATMNFRRRIWEIYAPSWIQNVVLPEIANDKPAKGKFRWDISYLTSSANLPNDLDNVEKVDRVSTTSQEFDQ